MDLDLELENWFLDIWKTLSETKGDGEGTLKTLVTVTHRRGRHRWSSWKALLPDTPALLIPQHCELKHTVKRLQNKKTLELFTHFFTFQRLCSKISPASSEVLFASLPPCQGFKPQTEVPSRSCHHEHLTLCCLNELDTCERKRSRRRVAACSSCRKTSWKTQRCFNIRS